MTTTVSISPLTRIEGHLAIHTKTESVPDAGGFRITEAHCEGEMFRGLETILTGRDPLDAQQITQRICGVCPISHGMASLMAQEMAYGITPTRNGRLAQNLIFAANYLQSHIHQLYNLPAHDIVDIKAVLKYNGSDPLLQSLRAWVETAVAQNQIFAGAPFLPRYEVDQYIDSDDANWRLIGHYVQALTLRTIAHEMAAVFGAKLPHSTALVPTGVTGRVTMERILTYKSRLTKLASFVDNTYLPDLLVAAKAFPDYWTIGTSYPNYLSFGAFRMEEASGERVRTFLPSGAVFNGRYQDVDTRKIGEYVGHSRYSSGSGLHPFNGETTPDIRKGYSWLKAPRYDNQPVEVGPLARVMAAYHAPNGGFFKREVDAVLASVNLTADALNSVLGRHLARGLEAKWIAQQAALWLEELEPGQPTAKQFSIPATGRGVGLVEAPRGALGHWLILENHKIRRYQCIVPTTWNCSPRDDSGRPGPVEKALEGTRIADSTQPIEAGRVVRSFDPCIACAVH